MHPFGTTAHLLATLRLNQVQFVPTRDGDLVLKRRFPHVKIILPLGNLYLEMAGIPVRVLSEAAWMQREISVYQDVYAISLKVDGHGWLHIPKARGLVLATLLTSRTTSLQLKITAFVAAILALNNLHDHGMSHGDATVENVAYDADGSIARWFDFDTAHHRIDGAMRRADDLRALLFSAASCIAIEDIDAFVIASLESWNDEPSLVRLGTLIKDSALRHNLFHLAQMKGDLKAHDQCVQRLKLKLA